MVLNTLVYIWIGLLAVVTIVAIGKFLYSLSETSEYPYDQNDDDPIGVFIYALFVFLWLIGAAFISQAYQNRSVAEQAKAEFGGSSYEVDDENNSLSWISDTGQRCEARYLRTTDSSAEQEWVFTDQQCWLKIT